ncbi:MAG TPA: ethanolamine ammonia-lyase subunit EutB, partial [Anaerovoracaceae bacterium]|nr:ethanolamine ammonia-lyase subunit EutB [Anaerovoracaceae bacterium]
MNLKSTINNKTFVFKSVREVLAKANEEKSGDMLAGIAAESATERVAAKLCLANLTLKDIYENPVLPCEKDEVSKVIYDGCNTSIYNRICNYTVGDMREYLMKKNTKQAEILNMSRGMTSEMIAAVAKLMSNMDLIYTAKK